MKAYTMVVLTVETMVVSSEHQLAGRTVLPSVAMTDGVWVVKMDVLVGLTAGRRVVY